MSLDLALQYLTWALYGAIFVLVLAAAIRVPTAAHWEVAAFFGVTALVIVLAAAQAALDLAPAPWLSKVTASLVMALPYLLLRLVDHFTPVPWGGLRGAEAGLALSALAIVLAPAPLPAAVTAPLVAYFVAVAAYDAQAFVRQALQARGVTQRRLQAVALGTGLLALAVLGAGVAALVPATREAWTVLGRLLSLGSGMAYYLGFAPPTWLRRAWQEPALRVLLERVAQLPYVPDLPAVVAELEHGAAMALGAPGATIGLWLEDEGVLRFYHGAGWEPMQRIGGRLEAPAATALAEAARACGLTMEGPVLDVPPDRLISGRAFREQRAIFSADVLRDDPQTAPLYRALHVRAVVAAPITSGERRLGVLTVRSPRAPLFAASDVELARLLAIQAAAVLESRRLLEEAARARAREEADRLKDEFLASLSHDLRNPLAAVRGMAQVLERRLAREGTVAPERLATALKSIVGATSQMAALTDQLLDHARLRFDRPLELERRPMDLIELARRVVEAQAAAAERHYVRLETAGEPVVGQWDPARLERVVQNLLGNAVKFSPQGGEIVVRIWRERAHGADGAEWAALSVRDQGIGIPAADLPRVFERFGRASNVRGQIAGTGIGLASARWIVEQHGGTISAESEEGRGSTFTVRLPFGPSASGGAAPPRPEGGGGLAPESPRPLGRPAPGRSADHAPGPAPRPGLALGGTAA